jgi:hypothetical protein
LTIPVQIDSIVDLTGNGLESADLVLYYDARVLDIESVSLGSLFTERGANWIVSSRIDALAGRIIVSLAGTRPLEGRFVGELVRLHAQVKADAPAGSSAINLAASSRDPSRFTGLNEGYLTLIPAPTDAANDPVDGLLTIVPNPATSPLVRPSVQIENDRLLIAGTAADDFIFVGLIAPDRIRVRIDQQILGDFPKPGGFVIEGNGGNDLVALAAGLPTDFILPNAQAALPPTLLLRTSVANRSTSAIHPSAPHADSEQPAAESIAPHDLALLGLMDGWSQQETGSAQDPVNPSARRRLRLR